MSIRKTLDEIAETQAFERLESFRDSAHWDDMTVEERELLALLFVIQGENQLSMGQNEVIDTFALANRIAPGSAKVYFRQGLAFSEHHKDIQCLLQAQQALERALGIDAMHLDAWYVLANVQVHLGTLLHEVSHLREGEQCFAKVYSLSKETDKPLEGHFFWHWGLSWAALASQSGEAYDLRMAIDKFRQAIDHGFEHAALWNDYGCALLEMSRLVENEEIIQEAVNCFERSVAKDPEDFLSWLHLGTTSTYLFQMGGDKAWFERATKAFEKASELPEIRTDLWLHWGQLLLSYSKLYRDIGQLRTAIDYFEKAAATDDNHPSILSGHAEAQLLLGTQTERLDLIRAAHTKILRCVELIPENPRIWYLYGSCLNELGRYFGDETYYHQAIEKFNYGLNLNDSDPLLWYGLSLAHFALGDLKQDPELVEQAAGYCAHVVELGGKDVPQFYCDWGVSLMKLAELTNQREYLERAIDKLEIAIGGALIEKDWDSVDPEWLYHYGCALDFMGDFTDDPQYYEKAIQMLSQVLILDPDYNHAKYNLALSLAHMGELTTDVDCFNKAIELFQAVVERDGEDEVAWNDWGLTLINLAQLMREPSRPDISAGLLQQAEAKLLHAVALGSVQAHYNLACLYSLMGNYPAALYFIERADHAGVLPPLEEMSQDEWLEPLRQTDDFRQFIHHLASKTGKHKER